MRAIRYRGFTLVEVMTVMVVIGILAAVLMPRFSQARSTADVAACQGNLNAIGKAVRLYANDHDQNLPASLSDLTTVSGTDRAYMRERLTCPSSGRDYLYQAGDDRSTYTVVCPGTHGSDVAAGYPQYQTSGVVLH